MLISFQTRGTFYAHLKKFHKLREYASLHKMRICLTSFLYETAVFIKKITAIHPGQMWSRYLVIHTCAKYIYYSQIIIIFNSCNQ
jgi:hypothetical protein